VDVSAGGLEIAETGKDICSLEDEADLARFAGNSGDEHELIGRDRVGEFAPLHGSRPKNDHRLGVLTGLGSVGLVGVSVGSGKATRRGIEFRRLGEAPVASPAITLGDRSSTAPAVLGLDSTVLREGLRDRGGDAIPRSAVVEGVSEMIDEILPDTECPPGRAVTVLEVSLETRDNGRGMNSNVSENPTLARVAGLGVGFVSSADGFSESSAVSCGVVSDGRDLVESSSGDACFMSGNA